MTAVVVSGKCRCCGCTALDCRKCVERTGYPCDWADEDHTLCTACVCDLCGEAAQGPVVDVVVRPNESADYTQPKSWCLKCRKVNRRFYRRADRG